MEKLKSESRHTSESINKVKGWFFEKTDKIDTLDKTNQKEKRINKIQNMSIRNERDNNHVYFKYIL